MRLLITGGAGFIGSHLADALREQHSVAVLDDLSSGDRENVSDDVSFFDVDIRDGVAVRNVVGRVSPDVIFHEAAQISVSLSVRDPVLDADINTIGLLNVLTAAVEHKVKRFIFASSGGVLYGETQSPADENHQQRPVTPYGISKWVGERYLEFFSSTYGLTTVALRYSNVYGPRQNPHGEAGVVAIFARRLLKGEGAVIYGDGGCVRDFIHVSDVVAANVAALGAPLHGFSAFNVGTGIGTDVNTLATQIRDACVEAVATDPLLVVPEFEHGPDRPGDLRSSLVSAGKAARDLGWRPKVPLREGIANTVAWFAEQAEATTAS